MTDGAENGLERSFSVHARDEAPSRGRRVEAADFEAAALAYLDAFGPQEDGPEVALMVEDCETGERQCFRVDIATSEASPCD